MSNLFILGNGFDVAHGLLTSYRYFKKYMCEVICSKDFDDNEPFIVINEIPKLPPQQIHTKNRVLSDLIAECRLLYFLIDSATNKNKDMNWNEFESLLGVINWEAILEKYGYETDTISILAETLNTLENVFFNWANNITITSSTEPQKYLSNHISQNDDLAISFNYTETIEKIYGLKVNNICYIHGRRETDTKLMKQKELTPFGRDNEKLIVGHNGSCCKHLYQELNDTEATDLTKKQKLLTLHSYLYKDSKQIIRNHKEFYERIWNTNIEKVYSYGFSYSDVDNLQIKEVCTALNRGCGNTRKITWYFTKFDKKNGKCEAFMSKVRSLGFEGDFLVYDPDKDC